MAETSWDNSAFLLVKSLFSRSVYIYTEHEKIPNTKHITKFYSNVCKTSKIERLAVNYFCRRFDLTCLTEF